MHGGLPLLIFVPSVVQAFDLPRDDLPGNPDKTHALT